MNTPWGILKGIRPGKIVHRLWDEGWSDAQVHDHLVVHYQLSQGKADLLLQVCRQERDYIPSIEQAKQEVGLYVGIPFCPSRCSYCSFPSHSLEQCGRLMEPFVSLLLQELNTVCDVLDDKGLTISLLYVGGGTPSTLSAEQAGRLVECLSTRAPKQKEFTFEAGRPETMHEDLLRVLHTGGVDRLSINPQTMSDESLKTIGRRHTVAEIRDAYHLSRQIGFDWINMDLIAGLPGEQVKDFQHSVDEVVQLRPENITVHTLALKRASRLRQGEGLSALPPDKEVEAMVDYAQSTTSSSGYEPYYLYRQRDILGGLENVGYTVPGKTSRYNIAMISERMTILGFGGGAASKFVQPDQGWKTHRLPNPKDVYVYLNGGSRWAEEKLQWIDQIFK